MLQKRIDDQPTISRENVREAEGIFLKHLAGCGLASEVAFHDGIARYEHQYNRRSHHHMVCTECGASVEFFSEQVGAIEREIGHKHRYVTTRHTFQIYGVCEECRDRKKTNGRRIV